PALMWHFNLLGQLLAQFYVAKLKERTLREQTYMNALHQTGAKVTHDVKNLLQSLNVLCSAAERNEDPVALNALIRRNLPVIAQRLQGTMEKLQRPETDSTRLIQADAWWDQLQKMHQTLDVEFEGDAIGANVLLPKELFDTAAENLLQNALEKRRLDPSVKMKARFDCGDRVQFSVTDTGAPVPEEIMRKLLRGPVHSETGYGVGLYQVARQAREAGFELRIVSNLPRRVCFELAGELSAGKSVLAS
ncbi:MAG TPA: ATP-binding protein, partial [Burkholderiales bacterium]